MQQQGAPVEALALPQLREDLRLLRGATGRAGEPAWLIFDPARHRYFKIDRQAFIMLRFWHTGEAGALLSAVNDRGHHQAKSDDVEKLIRFLFTNNLTVASASGRGQDFLEQSKAASRSWITWLIHNYLFIRIPLVRPRKFLVSTYPFVRFLFAKTTAVVVVLMTLLGLYLASRQWDTFTTTFLHFFTLQGLLYYGLGLVFVKILHELGHAYTATRYGCRVPTMGVAFLVLMPVLYTDTTDAWALKHRRQRLFVGAAGIIVELAIAGIATFLWSFMADGGLRSVVFILATLTWTTSLLINLNPFMRFDGYYLLSDALGVENLQSRGFALGRWRMRELLFGLGEEPPETYTRRMQRTLTAYSWGTWIYRFFLFLGIALLIYTFFIKVVAIILFAVEIIWFILLPIWREIRHWWRIRRRIVMTRRSKITGVLVLLGLTLAFMPLQTSVKVPAIVQAAEKVTIYPPAAARIDRIFVRRGQRVEAGDPLFALHSDEISQRIRESKLTAKLINVQIARAPADEIDRNNLKVLNDQLIAERQNLAGYEALKAELLVRAPIAGVVRDLDRVLHPGLWVGPLSELATLVRPGEREILGVVAEEELWRLAEAGEGEGTFVPDDAARASFAVHLQEISPASEQELKHVYLASTFGGPVAVEPDPEDQAKLKTSDAVFSILLKPGEISFADDRVRRGVVHLPGRREAFATRLWRRIVRVLIRESGF